MSLLATNTPARAPLPPPTPPAQPRPPSPSRRSPAASSNAMQTPPFLTKLFQLVSDPATDELVSWTGTDGRAFTVHKPSEFGRDVLPKYFKHNNFSSFVRQLNQYGFHKQNPDKWMFGHDSFQRQLPNLLKNITRRRPKPQTSSSPSSSQAVVAPSSLAQKAVVELGNYGIEGEVKSLKRDKDLLIKELVVTRQAEEKLKEKCDNLETRMQSLEKTSGQMQSFIMHYFSQVLQPYSEAMASRKRKRLVSSSPSDMQDVLSDASNPPRAGAQPVSHQSTPTQSIDTLRVMMQQMQMNIARNPSQPHVRPPPPRQTPPLVEAPQSPTNAYAPATVQELPHEELSSGDLGKLPPLVAARLNGDAGNSMGDGTLGEDNSDDEGEGLLGFLQDMPSASESSLTMDAIELALKEPNGSANEGTHLDTPDYVGKQFSETNGELCDPTTCKIEEKAIEDFLDLDPDQTPLPPPLTHLPNGTDVHALALEIQGFKEQRDTATGSQ